MEEAPAFEGYLVKLGAMVKNWKRRYFVLHLGHLQYFDSEEKAKELRMGQRKKDSKGSVSVVKARISSCSFDEFKKYWAFSIQPFNSKRRYVVVASSDDERREWMEMLVLHGALQGPEHDLLRVKSSHGMSSRSMASSASVDLEASLGSTGGELSSHSAAGHPGPADDDGEVKLEGYLLKMGKYAYKGWGERFCQIANGHFLWHESRTGNNDNTNAKGILSLQGCALTYLKAEDYKENAFGLNPYSSPRLFVFAATSPELLKTWVDELIKNGAREVTNKRGALREGNPSAGLSPPQNPRSPRTGFSVFMREAPVTHAHRPSSAMSPRELAILKEEAAAAAAGSPSGHHSSRSSGSVFDREQAGASVHQQQSFLNFEGYLTKLGGIRKNFKQRFFVLRHGTLMYYDEQFGSSDPKGVLKLTGARVVDNLNTQYGRDHVFGVEPKGGKRMYVLVAEDEESKNDWLDALAANGCRMPDSTPQGAASSRSLVARGSNAFSPSSSTAQGEKDKAEGEKKNAFGEEQDEPTVKEVPVDHEVVNALEQDLGANELKFPRLCDVLSDRIRAKGQPPPRRDSDGFMVKQATGETEAILEGASVLHLALLGVHENGLQSILLEKILGTGADVNAVAKRLTYVWRDTENMVAHKYTMEGVSPLHVALVLDGDEVLENRSVPSFLLDHGANPNLCVGKVSRDGVTCEDTPSLSLACMMGAQRWMGMLLQSEADPTQTAVRLAEEFSQKTRRGAALYKKNLYLGVTSMHLAILRGDTEMVALLMKAGADVGQRCGFISVDQTFPGPKLEVEMSDVSSRQICEIFPGRIKCKNVLSAWTAVRDVLTPIREELTCMDKRICYTIAFYAAEVPPPEQEREPPVQPKKEVEQEVEVEAENQEDWVEAS